MKVSLMANAVVKLEYVQVVLGSGSSRIFWDAVYEDSDKRQSPMLRGESVEDCLEQVIDWLKDTPEKH